MTETANMTSDRQAYLRAVLRQYAGIVLSLVALFSFLSWAVLVLAAYAIRDRR